MFTSSITTSSITIIGEWEGEVGRSQGDDSGDPVQGSEGPYIGKSPNSSSSLDLTGVATKAIIGATTTFLNRSSGASSNPLPVGSRLLVVGVNWQGGRFTTTLSGSEIGGHARWRRYYTCLPSMSPQ
eukprot:scaffold170502_cov32-Tisochrysis_lutea.AAC.1